MKNARFLTGHIPKRPGPEVNMLNITRRIGRSSNIKTNYFYTTIYLPPTIK